MALGIHTPLDVRFLTSEMAKSVDEGMKFLVSNTRTTASVMPNFMFPKSMDNATDTKASNYKVFASEQEAMKWLLE